MSDLDAGRETRARLEREENARSQRMAAAGCAGVVAIFALLAGGALAALYIVVRIVALAWGG